MPYVCLGLYSLLSLIRSEVSKAGVIIIKVETNEGSKAVSNLPKVIQRLKTQNSTLDIPGPGCFSAPPHCLCND